MKREPEPNEVWHWKLDEDGKGCEEFLVLAWGENRAMALIWGASLTSTMPGGFRTYDGNAFTLLPDIWHAEDECRW